MIGHLRLVCGAADADLHAADGFSTERVDDRLHAVVAARAASQARADLAERHVDVVVDEHEVLGTCAERQEHVAQAGSGHVHERLRLHEIEGVAAPGTARHERAAVGVPGLLQLLREMIDDALTDVVAGGPAAPPTGVPSPPPPRLPPAPRVLLLSLPPSCIRP